MPRLAFPPAAAPAPAPPPPPTMYATAAPPVVSPPKAGPLLMFRSSAKRKLEAKRANDTEVFDNSEIGVSQPGGNVRVNNIGSWHEKQFHFHVKRRNLPNANAAAIYTRNCEPSQSWLPYAKRFTRVVGSAQVSHDNPAGKQSFEAGDAAGNLHTGGACNMQQKVNGHKDDDIDEAVRAGVVKPMAAHETVFQAKEFRTEQNESRAHQDAHAQRFMRQPALSKPAEPVSTPLLAEPPVPLSIDHAVVADNCNAASSESRSIGSSQPLSQDPKLRPCCTSQCSGETVIDHQHASYVEASKLCKLQPISAPIRVGEQQSSPAPLLGGKAIATQPRIGSATTQNLEPSLPMPQNEEARSRPSTSHSSTPQSTNSEDSVHRSADGSEVDDEERLPPSAGSAPLPGLRNQCPRPVEKAAPDAYIQAANSPPQTPAANFAGPNNAEQSPEAAAAEDRTDLLLRHLDLAREELDLRLHALEKRYKEEQEDQRAEAERAQAAAASTITKNRALEAILDAERQARRHAERELQIVQTTLFRVAVEEALMLRELRDRDDAQAREELDVRQRGAFREKPADHSPAIHSPANYSSIKVHNSKHPDDGAANERKSHRDDGRASGKTQTCGLDDACAGPSAQCQAATSLEHEVRARQGEGLNLSEETQAGPESTDWPVKEDDLQWPSEGYPASRSSSPNPLAGITNEHARSSASACAEAVRGEFVVGAGGVAPSVAGKDSDVNSDASVSGFCLELAAMQAAACAKCTIHASAGVDRVAGNTAPTDVAFARCADKVQHCAGAASRSLHASRPHLFKPALNVQCAQLRSDACTVAGVSGAQQTPAVPQPFETHGVQKLPQQSKATAGRAAQMSRTDDTGLEPLKERRKTGAAFVTPRTKRDKPSAGQRSRQRKRARVTKRSLDLFGDEEGEEYGSMRGPDR